MKSVLSSFYNQIRQYKIKNGKAISAGDTPFMTNEFSTTCRENLKPSRVTKSFLKQLNGCFICHSHLNHGFIIDKSSLLASSNGYTALSVYQTSQVCIYCLHDTRITKNGRLNQRREVD